MERSQTCIAHEKLEKTLDDIVEKLDVMMERQLEYSNRITKLETIVTNGLSHNVIDIKAKLDIICENYGRRLTVLESFSWFRTAVSSLRDNLFINILRFAVAGGLIYLAIHFGKELVGVFLK